MRSADPHQTRPNATERVLANVPVLAPRRVLSYSHDHCGPRSAVQSPAAAAVAPTSWGYGGGPEQTRYSRLTQINRTNVKQLEVAWTYDTGEPGAMQTQPIIVGEHHGYTPTHKAFAINAATGAPLCMFDWQALAGPNRALMYGRKEASGESLRRSAISFYALDH